MTTSRSNGQRRRRQDAITGTVLAAVLVASGLALAACGGRADPASTSEVTVHTRQASWVIDPADKVQLAAWVDEIFVGTVEKRLGTDRSVTDFPKTLYRVEVTRRIQGRPPTRVEISQDAGYSADGEDLFLFQGDRLLRPGVSYLFAARVIDGRRQLFPVVGNEQLRSAAETARVSGEYRHASESAEKRPGLRRPAGAD